MLFYIKKFLHISLFKKLLLIFFIISFFCVLYFTIIFFSLPKLFELEDYKPALLTQVYDRSGNKIGEFYVEKRLLIPYKNIPKSLIWAFVSAEDGEFFLHKGLNYKAIARAFLVNLKAGKKIQGGSTITQQLARALLLSKEKTYTRKFKEAILALRMENSLSKKNILYIYLNQIYFGHGTYGVEQAAQTYFRKSAQNLNIAEAALLAGLPKAPSYYSPVYRPERAKSRQLYVLNRMRQEGYISQDEMNQYASQNIKVFLKTDFSAKSPYYLETVRRLLLLHIKPQALLESGLRIYTAMDLDKQVLAQKQLKKALEDWDHRRGFRGVQKSLLTEAERQEFTIKRDKKLRNQIKKHINIPGFTLTLKEKEDKIPESFYIKFKDKFKVLENQYMSQAYWIKNRVHLKTKIFAGLISKIEADKIQVATPWGKEWLLLKSFQWAVPLDKKSEQKSLLHASEIFKIHDVALFKIKDFDTKDPAHFNNIPIELYQEPLAEAALLSFDLKTSEILALVGGYDYNRSQYNRAYQSRRQVGSAFKPFVYGAALERGFHPGSLISDSPIVFSKKQAEEKEDTANQENNSVKDLWRPSNISNRFYGDILFRKALIRSLNVPTIRITKAVGLSWIRFYARRLGLFSPLNKDFTMALGSSSLNLYETLKAFSVIANQGQAIFPLLIHEVIDSQGQKLLSKLSLDEFFKKEIQEAKDFVLQEKHKWFKAGISEDKKNPFQKRWTHLLKEDSSQLIPVSNSFVLMNLLEAVVQDPEGTARRAQILDRPLGGKTGTTDGYYDTWFVGSSPFISTAIWLGFDKEKSLGHGETGSRTVLPAWIEYMKHSHEDLPKTEFVIPEGVVFSSIDEETGKLTSSKSKKTKYQAFIEGNEPDKESYNDGMSSSDELDFIREDTSVQE